MLRIRDRDETQADKRLLAAATKSQNKDHAASYAAYAVIAEPVRLSLLRSVFILDASSNIIDLGE